MSYVWVVQQGEDFEGSQILGIFASHDSAMRFVTPIIMRDLYGDAWTAAGCDSWHAGVNYLIVSRVAVKQ